MSHRASTYESGTREGNVPQPTEPLADIIERIVERDDLRALDHLHNDRTPFVWNGSKAMSFGEFIVCLCSTPWAHQLAGAYAGGIDRAYDIVVDRFGVIADQGRTRDSGRTARPDCRRYYRPVLDAIRQRREQQRMTSALEEEAFVAKYLQKHVISHFQWACAEARRQWNPARTRVTWRVNGQHVTVWLPKHLAPEDREAWLAQNVPVPKLIAPGDVERIQAIIDQRLGTGAALSIEQVDDLALSVSDTGSLDPDAIEEDLASHGLAATVAGEKAASVHLQRPAIRALGASRVRDLVRDVFESLIDGSYEEKTLARRYSLSLSALSRFAGSRWQGKTDARPPDLWVNCAHLLAKVPDFVQAAKSAGVLPCVQETASRVPHPRMRGRS